MAIRANLVNLDAMIKRTDFAIAEAESTTFETVSTISLRDLIKGGLLGPSLRKPDFQRETNHWVPEQVASLLDCFVNGDLIPSVILWQSPSYVFVIDGGHRLSALRAWVEDDYGDGPLSQSFFGYEISNEQRKIAARTRSLINDKIGSWQHFQSKIEDVNISETDRKRYVTIGSRALPIQWVKGDADKAEASFFKINTKGTPLDSIEELLLKSRKKPISIASRAIIRAGKGHRYWSSFESVNASKIEGLAKELHSVLFDPEIKSPIKTLDLPLGGPKGVRTALQALIDLSLIALRNQQGQPKDLASTDDDSDGTATIDILKRTLTLSKRITGNDGGSLGLHPAVYFYGPTGRHSGPMFMGTLSLVGKKLSNNDKSFFKKFTSARSKLEEILVKQKPLIANILQKHISPKRVDKYAVLLNGIIDRLNVNGNVSEDEIVELADLKGRIVIGNSSDAQPDFSDDAKSEAFITNALASAIKCAICGGYIDAEKSVSYDHILRAREGGLGQADNCQLTHPYCNQSVKQ